MSNRFKLCTMMFLQFMYIAVFFSQLAAYLTNIKVEGYMVPTIMATMAWGALLSPIIGMVADRMMNAEKVLALLNYVVAIFLVLAASTDNHLLLFVFLLIAMAAYMPTWGLTSSIALANSTPEEFPTIRVFGSIGWACASVFALTGKWVFDVVIDGTNIPLYCASIVALVAAVFSHFLPSTPPSAKGQPMSIVDALGLRAFSLLKDRNAAILAVCGCAWMFVFVIYWLYFSNFLSFLKVEDITFTMNLGAASEILFLIVLPIVLKKYGFKSAIIIGLVGMVVRYIVCMFSEDIASIYWIAIALQGVVFGFFFVAAQIYFAKKAPAQLQAQAQGLFFCLILGVAQIAGSYFTNWLTSLFTISQKTANGIVASIDWNSVFMVETILSTVILVGFALLFRDDLPKENS